MLQIPTPKPSLAGNVEITLVGKDGRTKFQSKFKNMILDTVFDSPITSRVARFLLGGFSDISTHIRRMAIYIGADVQTPPLPSDRFLNNRIAKHSMYSNSVSGGFVLGATAVDDYIFTSGLAVFEEDEAVGDLTEIGVGPDSLFGGQLYAKTLIKDAQGEPTAVQKQQGDVLFVTYELRVYRPPMVMSETFTLGNESYRFYSTTVGNLSNGRDTQPVTEWPDSMRGDYLLDELARNREDFVAVVHPDVTEVRDEVYYIAGTNPVGRVSATDVSLEDRQVGPILMARNPSGPHSDDRIFLGSQPNNNSNGGLALTHSPHTDTLTGNHRNYGGSWRRLGVFVDPDTLIPKDVVIPAQHRLSIQLNPNGDQLVTRR